MAKSGNDQQWMDCDKHGAVLVERQTYVADRQCIEIYLSCNCVIETSPEAFRALQEREPKVGDAVKFQGVLWRIIGMAAAGGDLTIFVYTLANVAGQTVAHRSEFEWLGLDTLSGFMPSEPPKRKKKSESPGHLIPFDGGRQGDSRISVGLTGHPASYGVSTADMINDEVQHLKKQLDKKPSPSRPLRSSGVPTGKEQEPPPEDPETPPLGPIPKRDGEW